MGREMGIERESCIRKNGFRKNGLRERETERESIIRV